MRLIVCFLILTFCVQSSEKPNILFCIADDASFPYMSAYGTSWVKTPGFDRVAKEGILFTNAYTPNAKCAPSRASVLTGRNSWQLEEASCHNIFFPAKFKTYVEALGENGYHTGMTGKGWGPGDPGKINGKRRDLAGPPIQGAKLKSPAKGISNKDYAGNFKNFLDSRPKNKPFCFWYGGHEPHRAYEFGAGIKKGGKKLSDIDRVPKFWPDNEIVRTDMLDYAFEVEWFDSHLNRMINYLEEAGELDNTLIVVTSDNGMPFPRCKAQEYEFSNHMPMAVMWGKGIKKPGRTVTDYISFVDLVPTFMEVAGVDIQKSGMASSPGKSLTDIFVSEKSGRVTEYRDFVLIGKERHDIGRPGDAGYPIRGIVKDGLLYLENLSPERYPGGNPETGYLECDGSPTKTFLLNEHRKDPTYKFWHLSFGFHDAVELYDLKKDADCLVNQAGNPEFNTVKEQLKALMHEKLKEQKDPREFGHGAIFDTYPVVKLKNFYESYIKDNSLKDKTRWVEKSDFEDKK
ncbi:MAG: sulfatase [Lentisphaeraceae bacterium]|nr:sulfatase [Lentisphaeraceae bacterium]